MNKASTNCGLINDWAADGEFLDLYLKSVQENSVYKEPCFERKMKSEIKLNSEHFFNLQHLK